MCPASELADGSEPHDYIYSAVMPAGTSAVYMLDGGVGGRGVPGVAAGWVPGRAIPGTTQPRAI